MLTRCSQRNPCGCPLVHPAVGASVSTPGITCKRKNRNLYAGVFMIKWNPLKKVSLLFLWYSLFVLLLAYSTCVQSREIQVYYKPKELSEYVAQLTNRWAVSWVQQTGPDVQKWLQFTVQFRKQKKIICNYFNWNCVIAYIPSFTQRPHASFCTVPSLLYVLLWASKSILTKDLSTGIIYTFLKLFSTLKTGKIL